MRLCEGRGIAVVANERAELRQRISDLGLCVESCVGFSEWITEAAEAPAESAAE